MEARLGFIHHNMLPADAGAAAVKVIWRTADGIMDCYGTTVPADAAVGYAPGCLFRDVDGTTTSKLYCNIGTAASANFNLVTVAAD